MHTSAVAAGAHDAAESGDEIWSGGAKFVVVMERKFAKNFFSFWSEGQQNFPAVILGAPAMDEASGFETVHEFDGAVVANLHAVREFTNSRPDAGGHTFNRQHKLILGALKAGFLYHLLAEVKKAANLVTKLRQGLIVRQSELLHGADCIVPRSSAKRFLIIIS